MALHQVVAQLRLPGMEVTRLGPRGSGRFRVALVRCSLMLDPPDQEDSVDHLCGACWCDAAELPDGQAGKLSVETFAQDRPIQVSIRTRIGGGSGVLLLLLLCMLLCMLLCLLLLLLAPLLELLFLKLLLHAELHKLGDHDRTLAVSTTTA